LQTRIGAFGVQLKELGWINGQNVRIDVRTGAGDADRLRISAAQLVELAPDVISFDH
jgi:putative ABC transport system substrate-binding protein